MEESGDDINIDDHNRCRVLFANGWQWNAAGEYHGNNPEMSKLLHKAVREGNRDAYAVYQEYLTKRPVNVLSFSWWFCLIIVKSMHVAYVGNYNLYSIVVVSALM